MPEESRHSEERERKKEEKKREERGRIVFDKSLEIPYRRSRPGRLHFRQRGESGKDLRISLFLFFFFVPFLLYFINVTCGNRRGNGC